MSTRTERGLHGAAVALVAVTLLEAFVLTMPHAWGQTATGEQHNPAERPRDSLALSYAAGGLVDFAALKTPYVAVHFLGAMSPDDAHSHIQQVRSHAPEDSGVLHLFVTGTEAEAHCKPHDEGLTRLVHDDGGKGATLLRVDPGSHTVVVLDRTTKEVARLVSPHDYHAVSVAIRTATKAPSLKDYNLPKNSSLALQGYDPVTYFTLGKAVKGSSTIASVFRGVTYRFSSVHTRAAFSADPERYLPTYGGWCATAMGESGEKVAIDPTNFKVKDGRLFLFYKSLFADAKTAWNKHEKDWEPAADKSWERISGESPLIPAK